MLILGPHICSNICTTMGLHACQYRTCMHIQSDFDQHNITHSTALNGEADNSRFVSIYALGVQRVNIKVFNSNV